MVFPMASCVGTPRLLSSSIAAGLEATSLKLPRSFMSSSRHICRPICMFWTASVNAPAFSSISSRASTSLLMASFTSNGTSFRDKQSCRRVWVTNLCYQTKYLNDCFQREAKSVSYYGLDRALNSVLLTPLFCWNRVDLVFKQETSLFLRLQG